MASSITSIEFWETDFDSLTSFAEILSLPWRFENRIANSFAYSTSLRVVDDVHINIIINDIEEERSLSEIILEALNLSEVPEGLGEESISFNLLRHPKILGKFFPKTGSTSEYSSILNFEAGNRPKIQLDSDPSVSDKLAADNFLSLMVSTYTIAAAVAKTSSGRKVLASKMNLPVGKFSSQGAKRDFHQIQSAIASVHRLMPQHAEIFADMFFIWNCFGDLTREAKRLFLQSNDGEPTFITPVTQPDGQTRYESSFYHPELFTDSKSPEYEVVQFFNQITRSGRPWYYKNTVFMQYVSKNTKQLIAPLLNRMDSISKLYLTRIPEIKRSIAGNSSPGNTISGVQIPNSFGFIATNYMHQVLELQDDTAFWIQKTWDLINLGKKTTNTEQRTIQSREWGVAHSLYKYVCGVFPSISEAESLVESYCGQSNLIFNRKQNHVQYQELQQNPNAIQFIGKKMSEKVVQISQLGAERVIISASGFESATLDSLFSLPAESKIMLLDGSIIDKVNPGEVLDIPMGSTTILPNKEIQELAADFKLISNKIYIGTQVPLKLGKWACDIWNPVYTPTRHIQSHYIIDFIIYQNQFVGGIVESAISSNKGFYGIGVHGRVTSDKNYLPKKIPKVMMAHDAGFSIINQVRTPGEGITTNCDKNGNFGAESKTWENIFGEVFVHEGLIDPEAIMDGTDQKFVEIYPTSTSVLKHPTNLEKWTYSKRYHLPTVVLSQQASYAYEKLRNHHEMIGKNHKELLQVLAKWVIGKKSNPTAFSDRFKGVVTMYHAHQILLGFQVMLYEDISNMPYGVAQTHWRNPILDDENKIQFYPCGIEQWFANIEGIDAETHEPLRMNPLLEGIFEYIIPHSEQIVTFYQSFLGSSEFNVFVSNYATAQFDSSSWFNQEYNVNRFGKWYPLFAPYNYKKY